MAKKLDLELLEQMYIFIHDYLQQQHFSPSIQEIADHCFVSLSTAARYLDRLELQGRIVREMGQPRTIRLLETHDERKSKVFSVKFSFIVEH